MRRTILLLLLGGAVLMGCVGVAEKRDYYYRLGGDHYRKCEYKLAETYFQNSIQVDPEFADGYKGLADCCIWQNRWQEAESFYRQAIQLNPNDQSARLALAVLVVSHGRIMESQAILDVLPLINKGMGGEKLTCLFSDDRGRPALSFNDRGLCRNAFTMMESAENDQVYAWTPPFILNDSMPKEDIGDYPVKPLFDDHTSTAFYKYRGGDTSMFSSPALMIAGGLMFVLIVFKRGYMNGQD